ncbi:hypothetical protein PVK06_006059 [Gossypium arboreum]|uniref:Uncharacterized protein n=1 Tax=Gossypium arboreum TaxID=29729 RepID=A0ABR0QXI2_GOSAR|nr:hypothetical protein PVK06_006059 [Gossypium arboreum]
MPYFSFSMECISNPKYSTGYRFRVHIVAHLDFYPSLSSSVVRCGPSAETEILESMIKSVEEVRI